MGRRLCVPALVAVLTAATVALITGTAAATPKAKPTVIRLYVPAPGDVTLEVAKVHVTGKNVGKFKLPRRFHLMNGAAFPGVVAMVAAKVQRRKTAETVTIVAVVVNGGGTSARALATFGGATPLKATGVAGQPGDVQLGDGNEDTWEFVFGIAAAKSGFTSETIKARVIELKILWGIAAEANPLTPDQQADFQRAVKNLFVSPDKWDPSGTLSDPGLDTGHYDDGHAFGWQKKDVKGVTDGLLLATASIAQQTALDGTIYADAGVPLPLYRFSFGDLSATIDPGAGGLPAYTQTFSGTACGAHAVTAPWTLNVAITGGVPQPISGVDLSDGGPVTIVTHTTKQNDVEVGTATTTLQVIPTGAILKQSDMELNVTTTGTEHVTTTVPVDAPITATRLSAGASC